MPPVATERLRGDFMYSQAEVLVKALRDKGYKICFAESCTGGLISGALTAVAGASAVFDGGLCSYANSVKSGLLGVSREVLDKVGAVSAACALQMAQGALVLFGADVAVSVTGIAGPDGGTEEKPVGTVYICVLSPSGRILKRCRFKGDRETVRTKTVITALRLATQAAEAEVITDSNL